MRYATDQIWSVRGSDVLAVATVVLVLITAWYATETRRMVGEMHAARSEEARRARFERSRPHAVAVREALQGFDYGGVQEVTREVALRVFEELDRHGPLIAHAGVRERVHIGALIAFTAAWNDESMPDPELSRLQVRVIAGPLRWAVESYLREEPLPHWPDEFPMRQWAQSWAANGGRYESLPEDTSAVHARASFDALGE